MRALTPNAIKLTWFGLNDNDVYNSTLFGKEFDKMNLLCKLDTIFMIVFMRTKCALVSRGLYMQFPQIPFSFFLNMMRQNEHDTLTWERSKGFELNQFVPIQRAG